MESRQNPSGQSSHPGGNLEFWTGEIVKYYDYQQALVSEKKEEVLQNIGRVVAYFCRARSIADPRILDIGCGPGTRLTLAAHILDKLPSSIVVGVDASAQMIEAANANLVPRYGQRFSGCVSDINSDGFWTTQIKRDYDFIVSSGTLHYLSDMRRDAFFGEVYNHLEDNGVFVACLGNRSVVPGITEMEQVFRAEFTYNKLETGRKPQTFDEFRKSFEERDGKANINWQSPEVWLDSMRNAGFRGVDIVWHLWVRSIFVAIK